MIKYLFIFICMLNLTFSNEIDSLFSAINRKDFDYVKANINDVFLNITGREMA